MLCIKNGRIHDAVHREPYTADILIENGKLLQIGTDLHAEQTIDAAGLEIYPGFVDAHSHIGLDGYGEPGVDINERNDICCPQLRAIDGVNPMDESFVYARSAGITCVCTGPGSANVLGGTFTAIKTAGTRIDDMIVKKEADEMRVRREPEALLRLQVRLVTDDDGGDLARGADEGAAVSAEKRGRR